jgi:hypothetical protein
MDIRLRRKSLFLFLGVAGMGILTVKAQTVILTPAANNLFNTGFSGAVLAGDNEADTHYQLVSPGFGPTAFTASPLGGGWAKILSMRDGLRSRLILTSRKAPYLAFRLITLPARLPVRLTIID